MEECEPCPIYAGFTLAFVVVVVVVVVAAAAAASSSSFRL